MLYATPFRDMEQSAANGKHDGQPQHARALKRTN